MAITVDGVLKEWGERLFYKLPKRGRQCVTVTGTRVSRRQSDAAALRGPSVVKATIRAAGRKAPEVMVKISGAGKGMRQIKAHLDYISRNGQLTLENEQGEAIEGKAAIRDLANEWRYGLYGVPEEGRRREALNIVLSMPEGTSRDAVREAASTFAQRQFGWNHSYVFTAHEDEPHPHVHLCVKVLGLDGTRLNPRKADLQLWREQFAESLREQGVSACATPRIARGTRRPTQSQAKCHREEGRDGKGAHVPIYPSEQSQINDFARVAKQLAAVSGEGADLAMHITRIVQRMEPLARRQLSTEQVRGNHEKEHRVSRKGEGVDR